jgi:hypothetical protein
MRPLCASGRTAFVKAIFDCLKMVTCQSPSDPSGATQCVQATIHAHATAADHALGEAICACSSEPNCDVLEPAYTLAYAMMLSEADVLEVTTTCVQRVPCQDQNACFSLTVLEPATGCP